MIYLVDFFDHVTKESINQYFTENNLTVVKEYDRLGNVYQVEASTAPPVTDIIEHVVDNTATPVVPMAIEYKSFPVSDDDNEHWWKLATVNIKDYNVPTIMHPMNETKIDVYIMDSGIKADHPEFANVSIENVYTYDGVYSDTNGHGTAIASLISGVRCSLVNSNIKVVKIFGSSTTYQSHMLDALEAILVRRGNNIYPCIVNMSWTIPKNELIEKKIQKLIDNNILVVCAAGNGGQPIADVTPASMKDPITVGSYNKEFYPSNFSDYTGPKAITTADSTTNWGELDTWAPGEWILVASLDGGYNYAAGTSMAAAIVSASMAYAYADFYTSDAIPGDWMNYETLRNWHIDTSVSKMGMLVLEGNYVDCANRITVINSQVNNQQTYDTRFVPVLVRAESGHPFLSRVFAKRYSSSFTINPPEDDEHVPPPMDGLIWDNGWLKGTITIPSDVPYKVYYLTLTHTLDELSMSTQQTLTLIVKQPDLDPTTIAESNPDLPLLITPAACYTGGFTPYYGYTGGWGICYNGYCTGGSICGDWWWYCSGTGKTYYCFCAAGCG